MPIPYAKHEITTEDIDAVVEALKSEFLTNGEFLPAFENEFAGYTGAKHAIGVSSGTAGLYLAVRALGLEPGQKVIVPSLTFTATANAALHNGGCVEFVDIDPETLLLDIHQISTLVEANPKQYAGIIAVDFAGYPVDSKELSDLCKQHQMWFVEDAAHALGAVSKRHGDEVVVGSSEYADATVFSFHPTKHITTGEGGMVTTNRTDVDSKLRLLRNHCLDRRNAQTEKEGWYYRIEELGYNYRLGEMNAALGLSQLRRLNHNLARRQEIAQKYKCAFANSDIGLPKYDELQINAYHLFIVRVQNRKNVYDALRTRGIFPQVHYVPLHKQPFFEAAVGRVNLPNTETYYHECLSLPIYSTLSDNDQSYVIDSIRMAIKKQS